ncbi:helix-turn-helix domain-containing protein [Silvimonas sp.]|uniref:helix-turn-helix domain-containing protein n=1 Tax=Silvimonas sp. TaxID=2650811 RepID=UPI00283D380A|nr:helix-turn-helix domain-containing protein [Silvimonas sp.]MDR3429709.1 helix-turn-helix domain-containing protein [Silvimonas sp.]
MKPLSVDEAAAFVRLPVSTFRRIAKENDVPRAKIGKRVIYLDIDLVAMVQKLQNAPAAAGVAKEKHSCQSNNVVRFGGAISQNQMERDLEGALRPTTSARRRSFTTA